MGCGFKHWPRPERSFSLEKATGFKLGAVEKIPRRLQGVDKAKEKKSLAPGVSAVVYHVIKFGQRQSKGHLKTVRTPYMAFATLRGIARLLSFHDLRNVDRVVARAATHVRYGCGNRYNFNRNNRLISTLPGPLRAVEPL